MVRVTLPGFTLPQFKIPAGWLLDKEVLKVRLRIPPFDITFWPEITFWDDIKIFDSDWISGALINPLDAAKDVLLEKIPDLVWGAAKNTLDKWAEEYYKRHEKE